MKFVSWNVNGLRACIQKGFLDVFNEMDADFFCLQETKLSAGQLELNMPGYQQYWCYADKKGYSGTAIFTKHTPLSVSYGIGDAHLDNEGRVITLEYREFWLVTCYTPNAQRGLARIDHRMEWDEAFRGYLRRLDEVKPVVICGDLNVAHQEIDLKNPASNRGNAGFSDQERESFQKTLDLGFADTFRHLYPDATGKYSWWSYMYHARENNAGWRIDYFLVSDRLKDTIYQADIHPSVMGSDHCPVSLDLDTLVNGCIFSPSAGPATVVEQEPKPTKKSKASAPNAKTLVPLALVLILVLGVVLLQQESAVTPTLPVTGPTEQYWWSLELEVYSKPLSKPIISGVFFTGDADPDLNFNYSGDGSLSSSLFMTSPMGSNELFYISRADGLSGANFWMRVSFIGDAAKFFSSGWNVNCEFTPMEGVDTDSAFIVCSPYYTDSTGSEMAGWLLWGTIPTDMTVDISIGKDATGFLWSKAVSLAHYLTSTEVDSMTTQELVSYIASNSKLQAAVLTFNSMQTAIADELYEDFSPYHPALTYLQSRTDAVKEMMNAEVSEEEGQVLYWLLTTSFYRQKMTAYQEVEYITGQYNSYPFEVSNNSIAVDPDISTEALVSILGELPLFDQCSTNRAMDILYDYYNENNPFVRKLFSRRGALKCLMDGVQENLPGSIYLIAATNYFSIDDLSDADLTRFMTAAAAVMPERLNVLFDTNISYDLAEHFTTADLVQYIINNDRISRSVLDSGREYSQLYSDDVYARYDALQVLETRDDAISTLMSVAHNTDGKLIDALLSSDRLRLLMSPAEEASFILKQYDNALEPFDISTFAFPGNLTEMSTDELVLALRSVEIDPILSAGSPAARTEVITVLLTVSPLLDELSRRADAVDVMMNITPSSPVITYLLSHECFSSQMTQEQRELFSSGQYSTAVPEDEDHPE